MAEDDDLEAFSMSPTRGAAPPGMPDPEPEIVARAQQIINQTGAGQAFSTLGDTSDVEVDKGVTDISAAEKLTFLTHLLGNAPMERTFSFFGGRLAMTFSTVSAATEQLVGRLLLADEKEGRVAPHDRQLRYSSYMLAASLRRVDIDKRKARVEVFVASNDLDGHRAAYETWFSELSHEMYRLLQGAYKQFRERILFLMRKADDPDFWPTPS